MDTGHQVGWLRYAAARGLPPDSYVSPLSKITSMFELLIRREDVQRAVEVEGNPIVRRGLAWRLGQPEMKAYHFEMQWPEKVYKFDSDGLGVIYENFLPPGDKELVEAVQEQRPFSIAYRRSISEDIWGEMASKQSLPQIQAVLRRLSPLQRPGLGTFEYLKDIPEIDNMYLFFRQWTYYIELDLPLTKPYTPPSIPPLSSQ